MRRRVELNLKLFDGEGGTPAPAAGAEQTGENVQNTTGGEEGTGAGQTPEERMEAYEKMKQDYKDLYGEDVRKQVSRRYRENESLHQQLDSYSPLMSLLASRYGVENADVNTLMQAIENDDSFWEEQAMKENLSVEQLKHMRKMEAENKSLIEANQRSQQIRQREDTYARWDRESEACRQQFPQFDMQAECENPQFVRLLGAGLDVASAYKAVHFDELTQGLMAQAEKDTKKKVADNIRAGAGRPMENGTGGQAKNGKINAWDLSDKEFRAYLERARRGETVTI